MERRHRPAVDTSIAPLNGVSRDGQPLSYNRAPAADLTPWIARVYVTKVAAPDNHRLECGLFNDAACIRIQLAGDWTAETADGTLRHSRAALFFGPQTRRMPVTVQGSFISIGIALRPGACTVLRGPQLDECLDRILPADGLFADVSAPHLAMFEPDAQPEEWARLLEDTLRRRITRMNAAEPDPVTQRFEWIAFHDPSISVTDFAREWGVEKRTLERIVRRDFGMSPKQVLRRARALDMGSHLRGVADLDEAADLALRYYDQSHLIREFVDLFGMSPSQFVAKPQPILTLTLESRQARRLEVLERLAPGEPRPWQ